MRRAARLARFRVVLRTALGFVLLGVGSSVLGAGAVSLLLVLEGLPSDFGDRNWVFVLCAAAYVAFSLGVGSLWMVVLHRRTAVWFAVGRRPTPAEAERALRLPRHMALVSGSLWLGGTIVLGGITPLLASWPDSIGVALTVGLGGLLTVGLMYLATEWVSRPILIMALEVNPPQDGPSVSVLARLVLTWGVASGVPLLGVLILAAPPNLGRADNAGSLIVLAVVGLGTGAFGTALLARAVAAPLDRLRLAVGEVAKGRTDIEVQVDDVSEIGQLQVSVNSMVAGLRERDRMRDLFGRHVGNDVARHALEHGASLSGDVREATALFVDVVDSTALAYRMPPEELVGKLNRLFACVVAAVDARGGLVNKFQGDAALCVFGAPTRLADPTTAALSAAREIRDAVREAGELDLGIGVACGPVFAGQLGTRSRLEYTVIGDAVNEAARLTEHAKKVPGRILASDAVLEACSPTEREHWSAHRKLRLRGRSAPTITWTAWGSATADHPARLGLDGTGPG
ncbi:adenylate/guanylate cyclase domain-containing protein [Amycolatopsis cynarae]|uniref:Adenylate/guanylate cyclase domain-containing protein n=1 Tax=Amycolatopsis cynarae TaxID=2995223 RepID=A0ABY7AZC8_9PSEU|nr:adenylate/guanylate cyclase domain-containing protein [Amycolatopsis sp. HUAS 11-8]WAL65380.1 adenylate/guanylate cyclase domain-containing protein [Amycolatopsis sp. HUAS 11-8]